MRAAFPYVILLVVLLPLTVRVVRELLRRDGNQR